MKTTALWILASLLAFTAFRAEAVLPMGPVSVTVNCVGQDFSYLVTGSKTNHTTTSTNIITVYLSKATNATINDAVLIALLENSFNTNFPAGAKLRISGTSSLGFVVADSTGTNILLDVGGIVNLTPVNTVHSGMQTVIHKMSGSTSSTTGNDTEVFTDFAFLSYDDSPLPSTRDGTRTSFELGGILIENRTINVQTGKGSILLSYEAAGSGKLRGGPTLIMKGSLTGSIVGFIGG